MSPAQDKGYWRRWSAVVRRHNLQRLSKSDRDAERHAITLEATNGRTSEHKKVTDNKEITKLFRILEFKAQPDCLDAAIPVANPELEEEADEQRKMVFAIRAKGLTDKEIQEIAEPLCRKHHVGSWQELPSIVLKEIVAWKQFQPDYIARRRAAAPPILPLEHAARRALIQDGHVYQLKPASTFRPSHQPKKLQEHHHESHR